MFLVFLGLDLGLFVLLLRDDFEGLVFFVLLLLLFCFILWIFEGECLFLLGRMMVFVLELWFLMLVLVLLFVLVNEGMVFSLVDLVLGDVVGCWLVFLGGCLLLVFEVCC